MTITQTTLYKFIIEETPFGANYGFFFSLSLMAGIYWTYFYDQYFIQDFF